MTSPNEVFGTWPVFQEMHACVSLQMIAFDIFISFRLYRVAFNEDFGCASICSLVACAVHHISCAQTVEFSR